MKTTSQILLGVFTPGFLNYEI